MTKLSDYLREHPRYRGMSVSDIGRLWGIERARASRILSGGGLPGTKNMVRIANSLGEHPSKLFEMAGQKDVAKLFRDLLPEHPLQRRLDRLVAQGLEEEVSQCLSIVEGPAKKARL